MKRVNRKRELNYLRQAKDSSLIKVITGVRRSGKSTLLEMYADELLASGVAEQNIISVNFEDLANEPLLSYQALHQHILERTQKGKNYVFLDEIQKVDQFEKAVDSLYIRDNIDLYITGSNAYFMSGEFATLLTGRYVEVKVYPFSFAEFASAFPDNNRPDILFEDYLVYGGFPETVNLLCAGKTEMVNDYLLGIYNTILNKDIVTRFNITDVSNLNRITRYLLDTVGNITSPKKITDFITSNNHKIAYNTVAKYLDALSSGLIFYRVEREDIRGKQILQTLQKYYVVDLGLRRTILAADIGIDVGHLLENLVYFELLRRRNTVTVGKADNTEVDFVVKNIDTNEKMYYQVAYSVKEATTLERELRPFDKIGDHNPKVLLTTDTHEFNHNGIKHYNIINWLLADDGFLA